MKARTIMPEANDGERRTLYVGDNYAADMGEAVEREHDCEDAHCEIRAALEAGFPLSAAHLLQSATETPIVDAMERAHQFNGTAEPLEKGWPSDFDGWKAYHDAHGVECTACGSFNYPSGGDLPSGGHYPATTCGNCLADMPDTDDDN